VDAYKGTELTGKGALLEKRGLPKGESAFLHGSKCRISIKEEGEKKPIIRPSQKTSNGTSAKKKLRKTSQHAEGVNLWPHPHARARRKAGQENQMRETCPTWEKNLGLARKRNRRDPHLQKSAIRAHLPAWADWGRKSNIHELEDEKSYREAGRYASKKSRLRKERSERATWSCNPTRLGGHQSEKYDKHLTLRLEKGSEKGGNRCRRKKPTREKMKKNHHILPFRAMMVRRTLGRIGVQGRTQKKKREKEKVETKGGDQDARSFF